MAVCWTTRRLQWQCTFQSFAVSFFFFFSKMFRIMERAPLLRSNFIPGVARVCRSRKCSKLGWSGFGSLRELKRRLPIQVHLEIRKPVTRTDPVRNSSCNRSTLGWGFTITQTAEDPSYGNAWRLLPQDPPESNNWAYHASAQMNSQINRLASRFWSTNWLIALLTTVQSWNAWSFDGILTHCVIRTRAKKQSIRYESAVCAWNAWFWGSFNSKFFGQ